MTETITTLTSGPEPTENPDQVLARLAACTEAYRRTMRRLEDARGLLEDAAMQRLNVELLAPSKRAGSSDLADLADLVLGLEHTFEILAGNVTNLIQP